MATAKASRSREKAFTTETQRTPRKQTCTTRKFISHPRNFRGRAFASRFHTALLLRLQRHSETILCPAWESKPGNRTSSSPNHAVLCLPRPEPAHNPCCNRARHRSENRARRDRQSRCCALSTLPPCARCWLLSQSADVRLHLPTLW